jgi:hypothetical protein
MSIPAPRAILQNKKRALQIRQGFRSHKLLKLHTRHHEVFLPIYPFLYYWRAKRIQKNEAEDEL